MAPGRYRSSEAPMDYDMQFTSLKYNAAFEELQKDQEPVDMDLDELPQKDSSANDLSNITRLMLPRGGPVLRPGPSVENKTFADVAKTRERWADPEPVANRKASVDVFNFLYQLPAVFYHWMFFMYHVSLLLVGLYIVFQIVFGLYTDYQIKFRTFQKEIILENQRCSKEYELNRCHPDTRVPAVERICIEWEKCMLRDPTEVASSKISASVLAEVLEEFVQSISYKSFFFLGWILVLLILIRTYILGAAQVKEPKISSNKRRSSSRVKTKGAIESRSYSLDRRRVMESRDDSSDSD